MVHLPLRNVALAFYKLPPNQIHAHCQQPLIQLRAPRPMLIWNSNPKMCNMESVRMLIDCLMCTTNAWMNPFKKCSVYLDIGLCHLAYLAPRLPSFLPLYLVFHKQDLRTRFYFPQTIFWTKQVVLNLLKFQLRCDDAISICLGNMLLKGIFLHQDKFW